ncbi:MULTISPECIES: HAMP domain-containing sensor histidine kinase [unclassified Paenarthrobacter]|uniref:sensor histidine kinase n=1 Tax=unclassified Paenarthrobacter TaxID=2634190 RepID=UPI00084E80B8|nr:HAMP domain-containing sensor histidine kinase [Paenarthrobacter sp. R1]NKR13609.1 hypothetical protein [Arthrobacter sp. M5]NKR15498.1 hypothetical protein [Arthrobacter sp. M6]OEH58471.1 hypothetical protein A5N17_21325 [Arthrobacter sp. D2]OEH64364.1 hypothetical protein A5N13_12340 [Arthrobacter sp. D4]WIV29242.1 HAMP domain-containing sensor histidine kinase [Paenarthrobacter sp. R1]
MKTTDTDQRIIKTAARKISLQIGLVSAGAATLLLAAVAFFIARRSQPAETLERTGRPGYIVIDGSEWLSALILCGLLGVLLAATVGLISARNAVRPLGTALEAQRRFVQAAGHELRTPLAVLDARLQLIQRREAAGEPVTGLLGQLRNDSTVLAGIVDDLLLTATLDHGGSEAPLAGARETDAAAVVARTGEDLHLLAHADGIRFSTETPSPVSVRVPAAQLQRMITALAENAMAHTPAGGSIRVLVAAEGPNAVITVTDTGTGVTGIDPDHIFDRFAHGSVSLPSGARRGYGIGLALVRETAQRHNGSIELTATGPEGTTLTLRLPTA